jgi:hypothetical protein
MPSRGRHQRNRDVRHGLRIEHMRIVGRIVGTESSGEVVFTFDPDAAGQKAAVRAFAEARTSTLQSYVAVGRRGSIPATCASTAATGRCAP